MKTEKREKKVIPQFEEIYIASDGTEFREKEQCESYETSALCAIKTALQPIVVPSTKNFTPEDFWDCMSCDEDAFVVIPKSENDIYNINHFLAQIGHEDYKTFKGGVPIERINEHLIIFTSYDSECAWWKSLESEIERFQSMIESFDSEVSSK